MTEQEAWVRIEEVVSLDESYRDSLQKLDTLPPGYALLFAFNYVEAGLINGGVSEFQTSSAWPLIPRAVEACRVAGVPEVERVLRSIVLYYDQKGRSRLKSELPEDFFAGLSQPLDSSPSKLEDEYYDLDPQRKQVWQRLLADTTLWEPV